MHEKSEHAHARFFCYSYFIGRFKFPFKKFIPKIEKESDGRSGYFGEIRIMEQQNLGIFH